MRPKGHGEADRAARHRGGALGTSAGVVDCGTVNDTSSAPFFRPRRMNDSKPEKPSTGLRPASAFILAALQALAACSAVPKAPAQDASTEDACQWRTLEAGPFSVQAQTCRHATGVWQVRAEPELPGFGLWHDDGRVTTVVQWFAKPADAPVAAILPELRAKGLIPNDEQCVFRPATRPGPRTHAYYDIRPIGTRLAALEATPSDQIPDPPCGEFGWSTHGVRYFVTDIRTPEWVVYVNEGQDGTLIDARSITPR